MGNSNSTNQYKHHHHHHHKTTAPHHSNTSTSTSTSTTNSQKGQTQNRKRKSLELPDLEPNSAQKTLTTLSQLQLKLSPNQIRSRSSSTTTSRPSSPSTKNIHNQTTSPAEDLKFDSTHHPSASISSTPINHNHPPKQNSPIISSAPLQQPIETVVPPPPPSILQPLPSPLPSLDADSAEISSVPLTPAVTESVKAATAVVQASPALDIGAGAEGVPTLITWKEPASEVFVTGTFSKWKQQIKLRKPALPGQSNQHDAFSALVALPPGPHQLKFIVDRRWKTSKYLPSATDDKGNLINYLQINPGDQPFRGLGPRGIWSGYTYGLGYSIGSSSILEDHHHLYPDDEGTDSEEEWTTEIPAGLLDYEEYHDRSESDPEHPSAPSQPEPPGPGQPGFAAEPPKLPAQLKEGILNLSSRSPQLASDDNSLLPRPDHSVLNHLAASPIRHGLLSVGVTSRFKRKYLTTVYYKPVDL